jgi:hypothetical protein
MFKSLFLSALAVLTLSACQATTNLNSQEPRSSTRTVTKAPDLDKWEFKPGPGPARQFVCRPLACPSPSMVLLRTGQSPTRSIDKAALEKFAKGIVPASVKASDVRLNASSQGSEKIQFLSSKTLELRGYPAVWVETRHTGSGAPRFSARAYIFAGNTLIDTWSTSNSMETARANLSAFVDGYTIEDTVRQ